ncbi:MAG: restriction endonuclease subunit S [Methylococcaceae bacterium]|nr:restriction endonuclease subunit S [Methylococcaceae bacterium]
MSSKGVSAMSEENKSALVPRLRFPEFREAWASSPMSDLYSFNGNNSLSRDKLNYEGGSFRNIHYGDIHTKFALHFRADAEPVPYINDGESHSTIRPENYCMAGDMVFADASEDMADIGKAIEIIDAGDVPLVSGLHTILARPNEGFFVLGFGAYLFSSEGVRKQIQREGQGAKVLGLSATRLGNVRLHYPSKPDEQQRIADCLSSLDELITAETQALTALKTHKTGLMQQLFPREGETVPRLRFPEFREAGEWGGRVLLHYIASLDAGVSVNSGDRSACDDEIGVLKTSCVSDGNFDATENKVVQELEEIARVKEPVCANTIIISRMNTIALVGANAFVENDIPNLFLPDRLWAAKSTGRGNMRFLAYVLGSEGGRAALSGLASGSSGTMKNIGKSEVLALQVTAPAIAEQERIADCLSSVDDLITAQSQRLDSLKTHKKGLMQQLFPVLDEVPA